MELAIVEMLFKWAYKRKVRQLLIDKGGALVKKTKTDLDDRAALAALDLLDAYAYGKKDITLPKS